MKQPMTAPAIDRLVSELYDLTDEGIWMVEGQGGHKCDRRMKTFPLTTMRNRSNIYCNCSNIHPI
jgi:hypothetical protein